MKMAAIVVDSRLFLVKEEVCFTWNGCENGSHSCGFEVISCERKSVFHLEWL